MSIEQRLRDLGITLPEPPVPTASYVHVVEVGSLVFVAGQGPVVKGEPKYRGRLGDQYDVEEGQKAARLACINALAQLAAHLGSLDRVKRIAKVTGYVACTEDFEQQHLVMNGASDLLELVFGELGRHARTSVGVNRLPFGIPVEIDLIAEVK